MANTTKTRTRKNTATPAETPPAVPQPPTNRADAVALMRQAYQDAVLKQITEIDPKAVTGEIVRELQAVKRTVIMKVLGIDNAWGRWEVDHCNGREHPIGKFLAEQCEDEIKAFMTEATKDILKAEALKLMPEIKAALKKEVQERMHRSVYEAAKDMAHQIAGEVRSQVIKEFSDPVAPVGA